MQYHCNCGKLFCRVKIYFILRVNHLCDKTFAGLIWVNMALKTVYHHYRLWKEKIKLYSPFGPMQCLIYYMCFAVVKCQDSNFRMCNLYYYTIKQYSKYRRSKELTLGSFKIKTLTNELM